jgi:hypothetical protein
MLGDSINTMEENKETVISALVYMIMNLWVP